VSNIGDRRSLQLGGLCPGTTYQVVLQLTDLEGNTATYTSLPSAYAAPSFAWRDASATTEKYAASISYRMHATASEELPKEAESQRMGLEWWGIFLDDQPVERLRDRAGTWCHAFDEDFGFGYHARDEVWPGNIPFGAHLVVWPGRCDSGLRYRHNVEVSFSEQVSLQRLLAGETVTFTKTVPFSETGVITVTVRGLSPNGDGPAELHPAPNRFTTGTLHP
jgi:hypothetical protein